MANLGIIDADPTEPPSNEDVIFLANRLLGEFNIPTKIEKIEHISAALFVILYESLFSERLPGIIRHPYTREDEIHNCQSVIDVLSSEIVHDNLSHIRGADIVAGNITAISNLLDIFSYLLEYVVNRIESDVPTDNEDKDSDLSLIHTEGTSGKNGPNTRNQAKGLLNHSKARKDQKVNNLSSLNKNENRSSVISHEDYLKMTSGGISMDDIAHKYEAPPSPICPDQSESFLGQKTVDSTDLEEKQRGSTSASGTESRSSSKLAWTEGSNKKDVFEDQHKENENLDTARSIPASQLSNGDDPRLTYDALHDHNGEKALRNSDKRFAASLPLSRYADDFGKSEQFRATVGPIDCETRESREQPFSAATSSEKVQEPVMVKGLSSSYNDLKELVERTAALTRVALRSSPIRQRAEKDLDITDFEERPRPVISSDGARRAKELNAQRLKASKSRERSTGKVSKKVAFSSFKEDSDKERSENQDHHHRHISGDRNGDGGLSQFASFGYPFMDRDLGSRRPYQDGRKAGLSVESQASKPRNSPSKVNARGSSKTLALHLAHNRQPELGAAHMKLRTEDRVVKKKQDLLRRIYDDNLVEFTDDVDDMIDTDNQAAKETEAELMKSYKNRAVKKQGMRKTRTKSGAVACKKPKVIKSKTMHPVVDHPCPNSSPSLDLKSDEDLLSLLLEEFPHLHLSDHTWHELWRKGLHQIEALTRVYQENKRKKSRAQTQMEEAAQRHDLLSNIMNKQLEHTKRMREIKERKTQQVQVRNKAHEKRIQSARARRYYNDYQVRARGKQLKRRTKEEMVFRELFKDALSIQKERINDIRQYTSDQRKRQESRRQDEIDSLENFYHDQFSMLAEKLSKEKKDNTIRNAAQQQMLDRMKRELRKKMEREIALYQEQIFRDDDDVHFRQIDADKLRHQLHKACYSSL